MKKVNFLMFILIGQIAIAAPMVTDELQVNTQSAQTGTYEIKYKAELASQGMLSNVYISIENSFVVTKAIGKYFKGPGLLSAGLAANGKDLNLNFTNLDGSKELAVVAIDSFSVYSKCINAGSHFKVCIDESVASSDRYGSNISKLVVLNLDIVGECGVGASDLPRLAAVNKNFDTYYFPNTFKDFNIDPIQSIRSITKSGKEFVEVKGRYGVYSKQQNTDPNVTVELLDVEKFEILPYSNGNCPVDSGSLSG